MNTQSIVNTEMAPSEVVKMQMKDTLDEIQPAKPKTQKMSHVPSIEQLSPGSPFHVRQSPVHLYTPSTDKNMEPTVVNTSLIPFERDPEIYHKQLREKDNQIQMLQQYVEAMKKEFVHFRQGTKENLDP